jgi:hypothetical protein
MIPCPALILKTQIDVLLCDLSESILGPRLFQKNAWAPVAKIEVRLDQNNHTDYIRIVLEKTSFELACDRF